MKSNPRDPHDEEQLEEGIDILYIPGHMRDAIRAYVLDHRPVGGFLMAVLTNDLMSAANAADVENQIALGRWAKLLYNYVPSNCHGSTEKVEAWIGKTTRKNERTS